MNNKVKGLVITGIAFLVLVLIFGTLAIYGTISGKTLLIIIAILIFVSFIPIIYIAVKSNVITAPEVTEQKILDNKECEEYIIDFMKKERLVKFTSSPEIANFVNEGEGTNKSPLFRYKNLEHGTDIIWDIIMRADDKRKMSILKNKDDKLVQKIIEKMSDNPLTSEETITRKSIDQFGTPQMEVIERKPRQAPQALEQLKKMAEAKQDDISE